MCSEINTLPSENVGKIHARLNTDCNVGEDGAAGEIEESRLSAEDVVRRVMSPQQERRELQTHGNEWTQRLPRGQILSRPVTITPAQQIITAACTLWFS